MPRGRRFAIVIGIQVLLCCVLLTFWPRFVIDDVYIFLTYARSVAQSGCFCFNPGEPSYGFSSPAYTLLLACLSRLSGIGVGVLLSNIVALVLCGIASVFVCLIWAEIEEHVSLGELLIASLILSGPYFFTVWLIFGMETGLAIASLLGFIFWLLKVRKSSSTLPMLILGAATTSVLATTRLESGIYVSAAITLAGLSCRTKRQILSLSAVALISGTVEGVWLLYAHRLFGTYMPWTSTARLIYYLPGSFGVRSAKQFYSMGVLARTGVALKAASGMFLGNPSRIIFFLPLLAGVMLTVGWPRLQLRTQDPQTALRWVLRIVIAATFIELILFFYLFPVVETRHLAPYLAAIWVLLCLPFAKVIMSTRPNIRIAVLSMFVLLWLVGARRYREQGRSSMLLHRIALSAELSPQDRIMAEPIGVISFESSARVIDMGGLTDRSVWPILMSQGLDHTPDLIQWGLRRGATKLLLHCWDRTAPPERQFGDYCMVKSEEIIWTKANGGSATGASEH